MKKTPPILTFDPQILAVIHRVGRTWRGLITSTAGSVPSILAHREFATDQISRFDQWLDEHKAGEVLCVLPSSAVICRNTPLPDAPPEQLLQALHLQAEAHLLGIAPPHRLAMAVLPNAVGETTRNGMVLAWPQSATFDAPATSRRVTYVPDVAALAAILNGHRPDESLFWIDRHDGSVALAITHPGGAMFRAVREDAQSVDDWARNLSRIAAETALNVGHTGEYVQALMKDIQCKAAQMQSGDARLFCPESVLAAASTRIKGASDTPQWWSNYGIAAGAVLARTSELAPLTLMKNQPEVEKPTPIRRVIDGLSSVRTASLVVTACVLILIFAPMLFAGVRLMVLKVRFGDLQGQRMAAEISRKQLAVYRELEKQKIWPMTKLLADITVNTPIGIELESIRIEAGKDFNVSGTALTSDGKTPAQLVALFQEHLTRDGLFGDIGVTAGKTDNLGRYKFDLNAKVLRPYKAPELPEELDYAAKPWSERLYGIRTGDGTATIASSSSQAPFTSNSSTTASDSNAHSSSGTNSSSSSSRQNRDSSARASADRSASGLASSSTDRGSDGDRAVVGRSGSVGGDFTSRDDDSLRPPPTAVPPALDVEQLKVMSRAELRDALAKVAGARQNRDLDKEIKDRLQQETQLIMEYLKKAPS